MAWQAWYGTLRLGRAGFVWARHGTLWHGRQGMVRQGLVRQGQAGLGVAGRARRVLVWQGMAWPVKAG